MRHVVAVADVGEADLLQIAEALLQGEVVGQRLAGMLQVAERVDHRNAGVLRHSLDRVVRVSAQHNGIHPALHVVRDVAQVFARIEAAGVWSMKKALPPMLAMPASKVRRVRSDCFSKNITICLPASALRKFEGRALSSPARWKIVSISIGLRSRIEIRSRPGKVAVAGGVATCVVWNGWLLNVVGLLLFDFASLLKCFFGWVEASAASSARTTRSTWAF